MKTWKEFLSEGKLEVINQFQTTRIEIVNLDAKAKKAAAASLKKAGINIIGGYKNSIMLDITGAKSSATKQIKSILKNISGVLDESIAVLDEKATDKLLGRTVIENGHEVGILVKIEDNPKGFGDVYHVVDADGDEWTFNHGQIKKLTGSAITVKT